MTHGNVSQNPRPPGSIKNAKLQKLLYNATRLVHQFGISNNGEVEVEHLPDRKL